jgi:hypothetical protein
MTSEVGTLPSGNKRHNAGSIAMKANVEEFEGMNSFCRDLPSPGGQLLAPHTADVGGGLGRLHAAGDNSSLTAYCLAHPPIRCNKSTLLQTPH